MIVVTGATGALGGMVVEQLLDRVPADQVGVSVRDPAKATALADRGVRVRRGDYDDPETLAHAFEGAERVLLVSAPRTGDAVVQAHRSAINAATAARVGRVLYTSHVGSSTVSAFPPNTGHAATEALLRDSGLPFTVLRNGFYTSTPEREVPRAIELGALRLPAHAPVSWTTHEDLAAATAVLLTDESLSEAVVNLTAGEAVDAADLAALAAELSGRDVQRVVVPDEEFCDELRRHGMADFVVGMAFGLWAATRERRFGIVDPTLGELIGRPTRSIRDVLEQALGSVPSGR